MELLIIPLVLALGAFYLNRSEKEVERKTAEDRAKLEREISTDRQQEAALQSYLDRMADLLLKENLRNSENEELRNVARVRTLTVLRGLDATRKGFVLKFLYEAGLILKTNTIVNLKGADFHEVDLHDDDLHEVNLSGVNLGRAKLLGVDMRYSNLSRIDLRNAKKVRPHDHFRKTVL